ncbi:MAG: hypothetical protein GU345_05650 [Acidilobus sp.]|nr:hypothetical protein [Acidilobus sp.]
MSTAVRKLEEVSRGLRREAAALQVSSVISEVTGLSDAVESILKYVECISSSKGNCFQTGSSTLCATGCGGTYYMKEEGSLKVWKVGTNAISIVEGPGQFMVSDKDFGLGIFQDSYRVRLGGATLSGPLSPEQLAKDAYLMLQAARKLIPKVKIVLNSLSQCARSQGLRC